MTSNVHALCSLTLSLTASLAFGQQAVEEQIKQVESNLSAQISFKDENPWTIEERMEHYGVPGLCIAVVQDHKVIWTKAYGVKDRESADPVTTNTLFQCASISKPVASAAALRLAEQGVFDLKSDVNSFLKSWKLPENEFTREQHVTLAHLVSHTGGVTVHGFLGYGEGLEVPSLIDVLNGSGPANSPPIRVDKTPGGDFRYSGGGYCIMQQMMMDALDKPFPEIMKDLVLKPLEMNLSSFSQPMPADRRDEVATGYLQNGEKVSGNQHTYPEIAPAGLYSTASELAQFFIEMQLAYAGKSSRILTQKMAKKMMADGDGAVPLGIGVNSRSGEVYIGHGGWNEGFSSDANFNRDRGDGAVVLTNGNHPSLINEIFRSIARTYAWHNYAYPRYEKQELDLATIAAIEGRYDHHGSLLVITSDNGDLQMTSDGSPSIQLFKIGENEFACETMQDIIYLDDDPETRNISFKKPWDAAPHPTNIARQLSDNELLPIEWLEKGDFDKALAAYKNLLETNPDSPAVSEDRINALGYQLLGNKQVEKAIEIFRINTILYPEAFNTFDSLGEGYMIQGNDELAIENYEKSLELDSSNENARTMIDRIRNRK